MQQIVIGGVLGLTGLGFGDSAAADELVLDCGSYSIDFSKSINSVAGRDYEVTVENYKADERSFNISIFPAEGLPENQARLQAMLNSDIICMRLDGSPTEIGEGLMRDGAWLFAAGCTGQVVRMADKC